MHPNEHKKADKQMKYCLSCRSVWTEWFDNGAKKMMSRSLPDIPSIGKKRVTCHECK